MSTDVVNEKTTSLCGRRPLIRRPATPRVASEGFSREVRQTAAAILEVLAGVRTPPNAAEALGITPMRYYVLEARALQGLVNACKPKPKGRVRNTASELTTLRRECERLRRECTRQQALVRAAQRTIGLATPPVNVVKSNGKKHRRRRPTARALKVVESLRAEVPSTEAMETATIGLPS